VPEGRGKAAIPKHRVARKYVHLMGRPHANTPSLVCFGALAGSGCGSQFAVWLQGGGRGRRRRASACVPLRSFSAPGKKLGCPATQAEGRSAAKRARKSCGRQSEDPGREDGFVVFFAPRAGRTTPIAGEHG